MSGDYLINQGNLFARKAVEADKAGDYETAVKHYKAAISLFSKYLALYPDTPLMDLYRELIEKYKKRAMALEKLLENREKIGGSGGLSSEKGEDMFEILYPEDRKTKKTFNDLVDMEEVKRALKRAVIHPIKTPDLYPLGWPKGILLFGPPGCGKTEISAALADEANAVLINVSPATIVSKWLGDSEKNVKKLFDKARRIASEGKPAIIFIDEVEGLLQQYDNEIGGETRMRNQFLQEMDGLKSRGNEKLPLFVIGATNKPWELDVGFIRRFEVRIYVPPPTKDVRIHLLKHYISKLGTVFKVDEKIDYEYLAALTENYSPADIASIAKEVQINLVEEINEKGATKDTRVITMDDIVKVIKERKPSIDPKWIDAYEMWAEKHGTISNKAREVAEQAH